MTFALTWYAVALFSAALLSAAVAVISLHRRAVPGGTLFGLMMCGVVIWAFSAAMESAAVGASAKLAFSKLSYLGTVNVAPLFLLFVLRYSKQERRLRWLHIGPLWIVPAATLILAATNERHGLVWSSITLSPVPGSNVAIYGHGPWYWVALVYYLALCLPAVVVLGRTVLRLQGVYLSQTVILLAGLAAPWIGTLFYLLPINPFPGLDLVSIGFAFTGVLVLVGISRFRLFDIVPVARSVLVEKMADGLLVLDSRDRIVDVNLVARKTFNLEKAAVGRSIVEVLPAWRENLEALRDCADSRVEAILTGEPKRYFDLRASPLHGRRGAIVGRLLVIREVTERKRIELEREKLIEDLQKAIADIKTLRGLLPICASCKKIRDDRGYWQHLELYVTAHSEAQFSHSLCPDCLRKLYPDFAARDGEGRNV